MSKVVPTILTKDPAELKDKFFLLEGISSEVQVDIVDGIFAASKTLGLEALAGIDTSLGIEIHLMVKNPVDWIEKCRKAAAERVVAQVEMMPDIENFLKEVTLSGMEIGLALDLATPIEKISPEIYSQLDLVLLMAGKAGFSGQDFDPKVLAKIKKVKEIVGNLVDIGVDIGLNKKNVVECKNAGANVFYIGKTFWEAENLLKEFQQLGELIK